MKPSDYHARMVAFQGCPCGLCREQAEQNRWRWEGVTYGRSLANEVLPTITALQAREASLVREAEARFAAARYERLFGRLPPYGRGFQENAVQTFDVGTATQVRATHDYSDIERRIVAAFQIPSARLSDIYYQPQEKTMTNTTTTPTKPLSLPVQILVDRLVSVRASVTNNRVSQKTCETQAAYYKTEADCASSLAAELTKALKKLGHKA